MTKQTQKMAMNTVEQVTSRANRRPKGIITEVMVCDLGTFQLERSYDENPFKLFGTLTDGTRVVLRKSDKDSTLFYKILDRYIELA